MSSGPYVGDEEYVSDQLHLIDLQRMAWGMCVTELIFYLGIEVFQGASRPEVIQGTKLKGITTIGYIWYNHKVEIWPWIGHW